MHKAVCFVVAALLGASPVSAEDSSPPQPGTPEPTPGYTDTDAEAVRNTDTYGGGLIGMATITTASTTGGRSEQSTSPTGAGRIGFTFLRSDKVLLCAGGYAGVLYDTSTASGITTQTSILALMPEILVRQFFGTGLYFGARVGMAFIDLEVKVGATTTKGSGDNIIYGPAIGYEFPITGRLSLVADVSTLYVPNGEVEIQNVGKTPYGRTGGALIQGGVNFHW